MKLAFSETFLDSLATLDNQDQNIARASLFDFLETPNAQGFRLEKIKGQELWSARINKDLRLILHLNGDTANALFVGHHDDAYSWASKKKLSIHPTTGAMQLVSLEFVTEQVVEQEVMYRGPRLFEHYDDEYLLGLGVPREWLSPLKDTTEEDLVNLIDLLPQEAMERLLRLRDGEKVPIPSPHDGDPLTHRDSLRRFTTVEIKSDLAPALEFPWAKWTVFLHPDQRELVDASFQGPVKISGTAGTGKTVLALHRAFKLSKDNPDSKVLITTYSRTLAERIAQMAVVLAGESKHIPTNLTISHIHHIAVQMWLRHNTDRNFNPKDEGSVKVELEKAMGLRVLGSMDPGFALSEWKNVVDYWGINDWDRYREFARAGRGTILGHKQRADYWSVFGAMLERISEHADSMTWSQVAFAASNITIAQPSEQFHHIVVDESQDFGPAELTLVRSLAKPGDNDLFLCGDAGQQIYRRPFAWSQLGIHTQGRSRHLTHNYRNTDLIQQASILSGRDVVFGGDGEQEGQEAVSLLTGSKPLLRSVRDDAEQRLALAEWLDEMIGLGYQQSDIAVFSRRSGTLSNICDPALRMVGGLNRRDLQDARPPNEDGVAFGTMHRAKGLEFKAVAIVGCGESDIPDSEVLATAGDESDSDSIIKQEMNLLHVALTRPREKLLVLCVGEPSRFLTKENFEISH